MYVFILFSISSRVSGVGGGVDVGGVLVGEMWAGRGGDMSEYVE